jgi:hypothetical protein
MRVAYEMSLVPRLKKLPKRAVVQLRNSMSLLSVALKPPSSTNC